jgi:hypothetical protein
MRETLAMTSDILYLGHSSMRAALNCASTALTAWP